MDQHDPDLPEAEEAAVEARLRQALEHRAASVQPAEGGLTAIEAGVAAERRRRQRRTAVLGLAAGVVVFAAVAAFLNLAGDDDDSVVTDDPTTTTTEATTSTTSTTLPTTTTTTTTIPIDDDGVQGWPGATSRVFDNPEAAALAFTTDVLGFAEPDPRRGHHRGRRCPVRRPPTAHRRHLHPHPLHDTGDLRGWVVTGRDQRPGHHRRASAPTSARSSIAGSATAFEATVAVALLDLEGNFLAEDFTDGGQQRRAGPVHHLHRPGRPSGTPFWVLIGEGDASGEGRLSWATLVPIDQG